MRAIGSESAIPARVSLGRPPLYPSMAESQAVRALQLPNPRATQQYTFTQLISLADTKKPCPAASTCDSRTSSGVIGARMKRTWHWGKLGTSAAILRRWRQAIFHTRKASNRVVAYSNGIAFIFTSIVAFFILTKGNLDSNSLDAAKVVFPLHIVPSTGQGQANQALFPSEHIERLLHDEYAVPYSILQYIVRQRATLQHCACKPSLSNPMPTDCPDCRNGVPSEVALLNHLRQRFAKSPDRKPVALFAAVYSSSLGSRVRAAATAIVFAKATGRFPVILWGVHPTYWPYYWEDIFRNTSKIGKETLFVNVPLKGYGSTSLDQMLNQSDGQETTKSFEKFPQPGRSYEEHKHLGGIRHVIRIRPTHLDVRSNSNSAADSGHAASENGSITRESPQMLQNLRSEERRYGVPGEGNEAEALLSVLPFDEIFEDGAEGKYAVQETDWAELSMIHAHGFMEEEIPVSDLHMDENNLTVSDHGYETSSTYDYTESHPLHDVAAADAHIAIGLNDELHSGYAPRRLSQQLVRENGILQGTPFFEAGVQDSLLPEGAYGLKEFTSVKLRLHDEFDVPWMFLKEMEEEQAEYLLEALIAKQGREIKPRALFVHVQYGLGNRLRVLGSAMAYAQETNRVLVLIWIPDHHLRGYFTDLFVAHNDIVCVDRLPEGANWPFTDHIADDSAADATLWYNFMRYKGEHVNRPDELLPEHSSNHIYASSAYVLQSMATPNISKTQSPYWTILKTLTPNIHVSRLVESKSHLDMDSVMGVHIRSKTIKSDITGIGADEYSKESSTRTDYWRNLTQVSTFIDEMQRQPGNQTFYVAADQVSTLARLEREFPSRIHYTPRTCEGRERTCLPYAMADIILLSKCATIRGSYWSSFSEVALRLGAGRVLLAGVDFGVPRADMNSNSNVRKTRKRIVRYVMRRRIRKVRKQAPPRK